MYCVYCLQSEARPAKTYVGVTNDAARRLRQHNGELAGGARSTRGHRPWKHLWRVTGLTQREALQLEWAMKHRRSGKGGPEGRMRTLRRLLAPGARWKKRGAEVPPELLARLRIE